jgi:YHS domain-containing protein
MIRGVLFFLAIFVIYYALKILVRSALKTYREDEKKRSKRVMGDEMVLDPECRTYVVKDRSVIRQIRGTRTHFCSEDCARQYEDKNRA